MKKLSLILAFLTVTVAACAQFGAGIRDSRYVYGVYSPVTSLGIMLDHSLYSEKMGFQRVGLGIDYSMRFGEGFKWQAGVYGATTWNRNYQVFNVHTMLGYQYRRLGITAVLQPHYDSELKYTTTWMAQADVRMINNICFLVAYTTIPEYRLSEKRLRGGFEFQVSKLKVRPELSFSVDKNTSFKNMRVLMSMHYDF